MLLSAFCIFYTEVLLISFDCKIKFIFYFSVSVKYSDKLFETCHGRNVLIKLSCYKFFYLTDISFDNASIMYIVFNLFICSFYLNRKSFGKIITIFCNLNKFKL